MIDTKAARALADEIEEASTVLDEQFHRDAICNSMLRGSETLRQCADEINALNEEVQRLKIWQSQMVEKAADKSLAGYRELADTCARLSEEIDTLRAIAEKSIETIEWQRREKETLRELVLDVYKRGMVWPEWDERARKALKGTKWATI